MTTIFNTQFRDNLGRIQSRTSQSKSADIKGEKDFKETLADLERAAHKTSERGMLDTKPHPVTEPKLVPKPAPEFLSNFEPGEDMTAKKILEIPAPQGELRLNSWGDSPEESVNTATPTVKNTPPEGFVYGAPQTPLIASVERVPDSQKLDRLSNQAFFHPQEVRAIINTAGKFHGVDPNLGLAVAQAESALRTGAISQDGHASKGVFQLLDTTGKEMLSNLGVGEGYDPFDPGLNAHLGVGYLRRLLDMFSQETDLGSNMKTVPANSAANLEKLAIAAFNAGEGNVARAQAKARSLGKDPADYAAIEEHLPATTRTYVARVDDFRRKLEEADGENSIA